MAAIALSELAGIVGAFFTAEAIPTWYAGLAKPTLNPPAWVFAPVWTTLYLLMGIAAFLVWRKRPLPGAFLVQLGLNTLWSIIFFGLRNPAWAFADIIALTLAIIWTMAAFAKTSRTAIYLLAPYLLWVIFAAYLNYAIWMGN